MKSNLNLRGLIIILISSLFLQISKQEEYIWDGEVYRGINVITYQRGQVVEYYNHGEICESFLLVPGMQMLNDSVLAFVYIVIIAYVYIGVYLAMDVLLEAINHITSRQEIIKQMNPQTKKTQEKKVKIWNPAIANLTMMVLGSCAPEIILNIIEAVQIISLKDVSQYKSDREYIGFSTIIGSAAFNVFFISAICIYAPTKEKDINEKRDVSVERGTKKLNYMGHYIIVICFNILAYIWLLIIMKVSSPDIIEMWEAIVTIALYIPFLTITYGYDKMRERNLMNKLGVEDEMEAQIAANQEQEQKEQQNKRAANNKRKSIFVAKNEEKKEKESNKIMRHQPIDFYRILIAEKKGQPLKNYDEQKKRKEMKEYLLKYLKTDDIEQVPYNELKLTIEGEPLISRVIYRLWFANVLSIKRDIVNRQTFDRKRIQGFYDQRDHQMFGFKCLKYSVNESKGVLEVEILNKKKLAGSVGVRTVNGTAKSGEDYEKIERSIKFKKDQESQKLKIKIMDNEEWEPDEEFFVELYDYRTGYVLKGKDVKCSITIIDDDNPGALSFVKAELGVMTTDYEARITVIRKNGCKGHVTCRFKTVEVEDKDKRAIPGIDYEKTEGVLEFKDSEITQDIRIKLLNKRQFDLDDYGYMFGLKIFDPQPKGIVKITMKDTCLVKLELDNEFQLRQESLDQYLWTVERQANRSWESQIKQAIMLHPTLNLDGTIDDVSNLDSVIHFVTIFWKTIISFVPPSHIYRGWPTLFFILMLISLQMLVILEFSKLFGCNTDFGGYMTALIITSVGAAIPDAVASWQAASYSKYADNALMALQCSVSVNIFVSVGISWLLQSVYFMIKGAKFRINADYLQYQVLIFLVSYATCVSVLFVRRWTIGGELGGSKKLIKILSSLGIIAVYAVFLAVVAFTK
eukprot:403338741